MEIADILISIGVAFVFVGLYLFLRGRQPSKSSRGKYHTFNGYTIPNYFKGLREWKECPVCRNKPQIKLLVNSGDMVTCSNCQNKDEIY